MIRSRSASLFARFAFRLAGLALGATLLLYLATAWVVERESDAELRRSVDTEIAALADIHATGGTAELIARIGDRIAFRREGIDPAHYLVADAEGRRLAGDLRRWPLLSAENSEAGFVTLPGDIRAYARATQLAPGLRIVAAREMGSRETLLAHIRLAFLVAGIAILLVAVALAWSASNALRRRVERANAAFRAIEEGDLERRVPSGAGDEFAELSDHANRLVGRLATLIEAQRDVTDQVAHEIRTPLMHLDSRLLRVIDHSVDPAVIAALGEARSEARGIGELLDSLLDIAASRARRGDRSGFAEVDLSQLAQNLAELYADSAEELGLEFRVDITPGVLVLGEAMQFNRLISNLLDNAFKYVPRGGQVALIVAPGPRIEVRDNGDGIPPELRERIFERFRRAHDGERRGHGLGLALARAIAERHGLIIRCVDADPGAAFVVEPGESV